MVERALGLLRERSIAMLQEMTVAASDRLRAEALDSACYMSNIYVKSTLEGGTLPSDKWYSKSHLCNMFDRLAMPVMPKGGRERTT